jgi:hypothetical protein
MFRRCVVHNCGGFRPEAHPAEDYDLWLRIIEQYEVANLPAILVRYRIHPEQMSLRKIALQRMAADRCRFAALERCRQTGRAPPGVIAARPNLWHRLRAEGPSEGADYCRWIEMYRAMGRHDLANRLIAPAIAAAPFCVQLYRERVRAIIQASRVRRATKALRWHLSKARSMFRFRCEK